MNKKITIGLPVFNGDREIKECLDSLLCQSYKDFELIISDNGSQDETEVICRKYASQDSRIRYIRHAQNRGGVANYRDLLKEASGEYFMWAAHDDTWSKNYLAEALELLKDPRFDFVFPKFKLSSIRFKIYCKRDMGIFNFIGHDDVDYRVISFINLHTSSHKCNIVYSFFRTQFIRKAFEIQSQENDGLLGMVILKLGRGRILNNSFFSKRYRNLWPGSLDWILKYRPFKNNHIFNEFKKRGEAQAILLFPEYEDQIKAASLKFKPNLYKAGYQI